MKRKIISLLLALALCMSLAISASAEPKAIDFVIDEFGNLTGDELTFLNGLANELYEKTGVGIFFAYLQIDSVSDYDVELITGGISDYVIMLENDSYWCLHLGGAGEAIDDVAKDFLRSVYDETPTYVEGVEVFLMAAAEFFTERSAAVEETEETPAATGESIEPPAATEVSTPSAPAVTEMQPSETEEKFLYDDADLLTDAEEETLVAQLEKISHTYNTQLVIAALPSLGDSDIDDYVEYLYDSMGFGYGETKEGVLLLICMKPREYRIMSNGYAGVAIGPDEIDTLCDIMDFYLPDGYYSTAFFYFAEQCGEFLEYYQAGSPFALGKNLAISIVIGLIAGLIAAFVLKSQLKSVRKQHSAHMYVKQDSMHLSLQHDIFLYRDVTRTERREREESTSSRTSSSSGSSGTARSKGGGSF